MVRLKEELQDNRVAARIAGTGKNAFAKGGVNHRRVGWGVKNA